MQRSLTPLALVLALGLGAESATALGLGKVGTRTVLGQPLDLTVGLRFEPGESLTSRCTRADVSFGNRVLSAKVVRARVELVPGSGERRLRITTTVPVNEPVVGVNLQLGCPTSLVKSFTVLVDPRRSASPPPSPTAEKIWAPPGAQTPVSPVLAAAQESAAAARREVQRDTGAARETPPEATPSSQPPAAPEPAPALQQPEPERLKEMEAALLKLQADNAAAQEVVAEMRARMRAAEVSRYANPLVYLLVVMCALLSAGLAAVWWLWKRDRALVTARSIRVPAQLSRQTTTNDSTAQDSDLPSDWPEAAPAPLPPPVAPPAMAAERVAAEDAPAPRRAMSAEELIDLEQQAEFFVVLGQDDAAIDLLMSHVRSTGGVSPVPYLKLLEIYRRRGERDHYDRMRERFNRRFNAYAADWDADPEQGLDLEGYPDVMHRLQDVWIRPPQAMELLEAALFRQDPGSPTFDVPAYRDLLFLYSTACDLAEREVGPEGVDLLLPLGDEPPSTMTSVSASPSARARRRPGPGGALDLDVSTDQPPRLSPEEPPDFKRSGR